MAYYAILIPPGLSEAAYRRAIRVGGLSVATWRRQQQELLTSAGFVEVAETDVTDEYLRIKHALLDARERYAPDLRRSQGDAEFDQARKEQRAEAAAIEAGLLGRSLFVAQRPR